MGFGLQSMAVLSTHGAHLKSRGLRCFSNTLVQIIPNIDEESNELHLKEAVNELELCGVQVGHDRYVGLVRQCGSAKTLSQGKRVHACIIRDRLDGDRFLGNLLVQMYGNCGSPKDAYAVFEGIREKNVFSWNIMMVAYAQSGHVQDARDMFDRAPKRSIVSWNCILSAYGQNGQLKDARSMFNKMPYWDPISWTAMLSTYAQKGYVDEARCTFEKMPERTVVSWNAMVAAYGQNGCVDKAKNMFDVLPERNIASWNAMIQGYAQNGHLEEARCVFNKTPQRDVICWTAMVTTYAQNGHLDAAKRMFDEMPLRSLISWNAMIQAYVQNGHLQDAKGMLDRMPKDDVVSATAMIQAYSRCGKLEDARSLFDEMPRQDIVAWIAIIQAYAQHGQLEEARNMFIKMPERNVISWNAMIAAYAQNERGQDALVLFRLMDLEGFKPEEVTYAIVVDACAGLAAIEQGRRIHAAMVDSQIKAGVLVETALVNMYGTCGQLQDARCLFDRMAERNVVSWNAMVAAYAQNGHAAEALELSTVMKLEGFRPDEITFVSILSACSHAGLLADGHGYFLSMPRDHALEVTVDHYMCMIDLLARAGQLKEAEELIHSMPYEPEDLAWMSLLASCKSHGDTKRGQHAAKHVFISDPERPSPYVLLSSIHAAAGNRDDAAEVRKAMEGKGVKTRPGWSSISVKDRTHEFMAMGRIEEQ